MITKIGHHHDDDFLYLYKSFIEGIQNLSKRIETKKRTRKKQDWRIGLTRRRRRRQKKVPKRTNW